MFKLTIETDNDAFAEDPTEDGRGRNEDVARILRRIADGLASDYELTEGAATDFNGNTVAHFEFDE